MAHAFLHSNFIPINSKVRIIGILHVNVSFYQEIVKNDCVAKILLYYNKKLKYTQCYKAFIFTIISAYLETF